jgi:hypothetical protein
MTSTSVDGDFPDDELNRDYARLVQLGVTNSSRTFEGTGFTQREYDRWHREVAERWWAFMRGQAERDSLKICCFLGADKMLISVGVESCIPMACLIRPDGSGDSDSYFVGWLPDKEAVAAMLADWGESLAEARKHRPYPYDAYGRPLAQLPRGPRDSLYGLVDDAGLPGSDR